MPYTMRILNINDDFFRLDVSSGELGLVESSIKDDRALPFMDYIKEMALDISARKPHLVSVYRKSENKYYGPFDGANGVPYKEIPDLEQVLLG